MPECDLHASVRGGVERGADARATARAADVRATSAGNVGGETTARVVAPAPARRLERLDGVHSVARRRERVEIRRARAEALEAPRAVREENRGGERGEPDELEEIRTVHAHQRVVAGRPAAGVERGEEARGPSRRGARGGPRRVRRVVQAPRAEVVVAERQALDVVAVESLERFERRRRPSGGAHAPRRGEPLELTGVEAAALVGRVRLPQHAESRAAAVEGEEAQMRHGTTADVDGV